MRTPMPRECWKPRARHLVLVACGLLTAHGAASAPPTGEAQTIDPGLVDLSLEEILSLEVESVSKHAEPYFDVPSSVYVLEREDILGSGATRLSELLQLVPGTNFTDLSYDQPNGTIRDFANVYGGNMLVLLDRVPVQSPAAGSFFFSNFYIAIEEIDRIEVILGPGGAVYGANAVTGVISIYTQTAQAGDARVEITSGSNGLLAATGAGTIAPSPRQALRGWIKRFSHDGYGRNPRFAGSTVWAYSKDLDAEIAIGNRFAKPDNDLESLALGANHRVTLSDRSGLESHWLFVDAGSTRYSNFQESYPDTPGPARPDSIFQADELSTRSILSTRFTTQADAHKISILASHHYEHTNQAILGEIEHLTSSLDLDLQDRIPWGSGHELDLGLAARRITFEMEPKHERSWAYVRSARRVETLLSGHAQNRWQLGPRLDLVTSCKAERWSLIGGEPQISAALRGSYRASERASLWGAFSRNLANPAFREVEVEIWTEQIPPPWVFLQGGVPEAAIPRGAGHWLAVLPSAHPEATEYLTTELGFRAVLGPAMTLETAAFHSQIRDLTVYFQPDLDRVVPSSIVPGASVVPVISANNADGWTAGGETVLRYRFGPKARVEASHALLLADIDRPEGAVPESPTMEPPEHQIRFRADFGLRGQIDLVTTLAWSSRAEAVAPFDYVRQKRASEGEGGVVLDDGASRWRLGLTVTRDFGPFRVQAWGRNLLADGYVESFPDFDLLLYPQTVERTFGASLNYQR